MNKTIKVIELLNMIAEGKDMPKQIKWNSAIWEYNEEEKDYYSKKTKEAFLNDSSSDGLWLIKHINDEVEIIEESEQDIDIQAIEEYDLSEIKTFDRKKLNELIKAVKQLDKNIKEK